ncbi:sugar ABC transporter permease [Telmatospirillum sp.]|uniref:carbohydrate ABC transporter permease n=1 Tax=Telmatospirillum sp. TaxID=2079197 RepID=UPI00284A7963|nr:sugar ABC transporter permease [Telmatospirillum sp.]MDR3438765.1 sugar ABC transporter permease [Telmatospirillum sp.]
MWRDGKLTTIVLFLPPAVVLFTVFVIWPILDAAHLSFFKWSGYGAVTNFVGVKNYSVLVANPIFHQSLLNSIKLILASIFLQIPLALALALLIYRKTSVNTAFRLIFFAPYILAEIATGLIWSFVFDGDYGITAQATAALGTDPIYVLADKHFAFLAIITVIVWKYFGYHMMIFIAALQAVSTDLLEAAEIDGARTWQTIIYVKLPLIMHAVKLSIFFAIVGALQVFDIIIPMTNGGPSNSTHSIVSYLYTFGLAQLNVGYGSAVGVVLFVLCITSAFSYKRLVMDGRARR